MVKINVLDSSEVIIDDYPFADQLKEVLVPILSNYPDKQNRQANVQATKTEWQWDPDIIRLRNFKKYITEEVQRYFPLTTARNVPTLNSLKDFWGNVYEKGDYGRNHHHKPSYVSCVYFLKAKWYDSPLVFTASGKRIRPKEGRYVLFPSHMMHYVPKHRYNHQRMTLSSNWNNQNA